MVGLVTALSHNRGQMLLFASFVWQGLTVSDGGVNNKGGVEDKRGTAIKWIELMITGLVCLLMNYKT